MRREVETGAPLALLLGSAGALALAPLLMPDSYDWVEHTTSESGAQAVDGAWLARLGLLLFGLAVLAVAAGAAARWGPRPSALHRVFGVGMIAAAAFASRSWEEGAPYDSTEDVLHSTAATVIGFSFVFGVLAVVVTRREAGESLRVFDVVAIAAAAALPVANVVDDSVAGLLQRIMFTIAYVWYGREALVDLFSARSTAEVGVRERR